MELVPTQTTIVSTVQSINGFSDGIYTQQPHRQGMWLAALEQATTIQTKNDAIPPAEYKKSDQPTVAFLF